MNIPASGQLPLVYIDRQYISSKYNDGKFRATCEVRSCVVDGSSIIGIEDFCANSKQELDCAIDNWSTETMKHINQKLNPVGREAVIADILEQFKQEFHKAERVHPVWSTDPIYAAAILGEETGETIQAALNFVQDGGTDEQRKFIGEEAVQAGAMALRLIINLDRLDASRVAGYSVSDSHLRSLIDHLSANASPDVLAALGSFRKLIDNPDLPAVPYTE